MLKYVRNSVHHIKQNTRLFGYDTLRCSSSATDEKPFHSAESLSENDVVSTNFINRNPRNLEYLGIARKRNGWKYQYPPKNWYHRLILDISTHYISGAVEHCSGKVVVSASTKEYAIAQQLYSTRDVCAASNLGRILALRCLQAGITNMVFLEDDNTSKMSVFREAIEAGGVDLFEPEEVKADYQPGVDYDNEEAMQDMYQRQLKVHQISDNHRLIKELRRIRHHSGSNWRVPPRPMSLNNVNFRIKPF